MANTKSAKKAAKQNEKRRVRNLARRTAVKTAVKKVIIAIEVEGNTDKTQNLLKDAASKLARAKGKGLLHKNTASRKLSRLAKRLNKSETETTNASAK